MQVPPCSSDVAIHTLYGPWLFLTRVTPKESFTPIHFQMNGWNPLLFVCSEITCTVWSFKMYAPMDPFLHPSRSPSNKPPMNKAMVAAIPLLPAMLDRRGLGLKYDQTDCRFYLISQQLFQSRCSLTLTDCQRTAQTGKIVPIFSRCKGPFLYWPFSHELSKIHY